MSQMSGWLSSLSRIGVSSVEAAGTRTPPGLGRSGGVFLDHLVGDHQKARRAGHALSLTLPNPVAKEPRNQASAGHLGQHLRVSLGLGAVGAVHAVPGVGVLGVVRAVPGVGALGAVGVVHEVSFGGLLRGPPTRSV